MSKEDEPRCDGCHYHRCSSHNPPTTHLLVLLPRAAPASATRRYAAWYSAQSTCPVVYLGAQVLLIADQDQPRRC